LGGEGVEREENRKGDGKKEKVTVAQVERLLGQLPGILSARIVVNDWGAIEEIHVLATTARNPKQIVRDVESSLAARWGMNVDHKKISIAQVTGQDRSGNRAVRLILSAVQLTVDTSRNILEVAVTLVAGSDKGDSFCGRAVGPYSRYHSLRLAAQATLEALNQAINARYTFSLEDIKVVTMAGQEVAVALIVLIDPRGEEQLLGGASPVEHDVIDAVVRAVLGATNRRVGSVYGFRRKVRHGSGNRPSAEVLQVNSVPTGADDEVATELGPDPEEE